MFRKWSLGRKNHPQKYDERLNSLLHEWRDIEPSANFETEVWRRIHAASMPRQQDTPSSITSHKMVVLRLAWINAMATAAGLVIGVGLAFSTSPTHGGLHADEALLHSQTLTGSYLTMVAGATR